MMLAEVTGTSLGTWVQIPGDRNLLHYKNQNPANITSIVLNILPSKAELVLYNAKGNKPFYVCINCKMDFKLDLEKIIVGNVPEVEGVALRSMSRKGEEIFSIWSSPELLKSRQYINNVLNTLCNREVMQGDCVPIAIKDIFQRKINELQMPAKQGEEGEDEEIFNLEEDWCLAFSAAGFESQGSTTVQGEDEEEYVDPFDSSGSDRDEPVGSSYGTVDEAENDEI